MQIKLLDDIATINAGHPLRGSIENVSDGEVAVIQLKDVDLEHGVSTNDIHHINLTGWKKPDYLQQGDIMFVSRGSKTFGVLVNTDLKDTVASPHFFIIRVRNTQTLQPDYLAWFINHIRAQQYFSKHSSGTSLKHVTRQTLENLPVIIPSLQQQELIVKLHHCQLKEKNLLLSIIEKKSQFLDKLLDSSLT
jgi:restriction endonuclease S subunit